MHEALLPATQDGLYRVPQLRSNPGPRGARGPRELQADYRRLESDLLETSSLVDTTEKEREQARRMEGNGNGKYQG